MDAERWERIQALFHRAADLPAADQAALLAEECKDEPELAAEVAALLREDASGPMLLDAGLAQLADRVLGDPPSPALPHQEFGRYRIKSVLGEGGMGVVYLAERTDLGGPRGDQDPARRVALARASRPLRQRTAHACPAQPPGHRPSLRRRYAG